MLTGTRRHPRPTTGLLALVVLAACATGCSNADRKKSVATGALKDFQGSLDTFDARVEASVRAIDRLQSSSTYDLPKAYQDFLAEYFNVSNDANETNQRAETMRDAGADYYVEARKEAAKDNDVRAAEELQRRQLATRGAYDVLQRRLGELREAYRIYQLQLDGIRRALSREQSRQRVASVATQLLDAREQAGRVSRAIAAAKQQAEAVAVAGAVPKKK